MKFLKHMAENLFITFTGIAALVHSTWSLGTMFSGVSPEFSDWKAMAGWILPAFFVAFSMDVGQISTSAKIRHQGLNFKRGITFFSFAVGTYYLQFVYIAHHMPSLPIAAGVSPEHRPAVEMLVNAGIWILPLLLPLSTMLYTISDGDTKEQALEQSPLPAPEIVIEKRKNEELPAPEQSHEHNDFVITALNLDNPLLPATEDENCSDVANLLIEQPRLAEWQIASFVSECECGRTFRGESQEQADRALRAHRVHCKRYEKAGE